MDFDLYPATPAPKKVKPATTTLQALKAAKWECLLNGRWQLIWDDHTTYHDGETNGDGGYWMCEMYVDEGRWWVYEFEHSFRGGPQHGKDLGMSSDIDSELGIEMAQKACRQQLEDWIARWTDSEEEKCWQAELDAEDGDDQH